MDCAQSVPAEQMFCLFLNRHYGLNHIPPTPQGIEIVVFDPHT